MKKETILVLVLSLICCGSALAQSRYLYGEALGASQGLGFNYDARFNRNGTDGFGWRIGIGTGYAYSSNGLNYSVYYNQIDMYERMVRIAVPLEVNYLLGKGPSKFETQIGTFLYGDHYISSTTSSPLYEYGVVPYFGLGYRLATRRGFLFRVGLLNPFNFATGAGTLYPYIGFGWAL